MANAEEKTALEILLDLPNVLKKIENKIDVLDTNLKILNSKLNKMRGAESNQQAAPPQLPLKYKSQDLALPQEQDQKQLPMATPGNITKQDKQEAISPIRAKEQRDTQKLVLGNIKVFSDIRTSSGNPVIGMTINIFDSSNDLIRNLRTDINGHYECKLPPGKYNMEMIHPKLKTQNKIFELSKDMKTFEVT